MLNFHRACRLSLLAIIAAAFAGCTVGPDFKRPQPEIGEGWSQQPALTKPTTVPTTIPTTQTSVTLTDPAEVARWWQVFNDPTLESLIARAIETNLDLRIATARV